MGPPAIDVVVDLALMAVVVSVVSRRLVVMVEKLGVVPVDDEIMGVLALVVTGAFVVRVVTTIVVVTVVLTGVVVDGMVAMILVAVNIVEVVVAVVPVVMSAVVVVVSVVVVTVVVPMLMVVVINVVVVSVVVAIEVCVPTTVVLVVVSVCGHKRKPLLRTDPSELHVMDLRGIFPLGPTFPLYANPLTIRLSNKASVSKLFTTMGDANESLIAMLQNCFLPYVRGKFGLRRQ